MQHKKDETNQKNIKQHLTKMCSDSLHNKTDLTAIKRQQKANCSNQHTLLPKQVLSGSEICSRFEQINGRQMPKRMTTGKFVYLGPTDQLPDSPI